MSKQKLTHNQQRRIKSNNVRALQRHKLKMKKEIEWQDEMLGPTQEGTVVTRYSVHSDVEDEQGQIYRCNLRRTLSNLVVGDKVIWRKGNEQLQGVSGVIEAIHPRKNEITRPDYYDGLKVIAANIDRIIIVSAVVPELSLNIIDRYLVVCENANIPAVILLNKVDLLSEEQRQQVETQLKIYQDIGYQTMMISAKTGKHMQDLTALLSSGTSIFVGQSGVGKSSLINAILPEVNAQVGEVSELSGLGKHTTTSSRLYHLPQGGDLIDSPGIRELGLWHLNANQITKGYREFQYFLGTCKFRDCKHLNDPGCALKEAVEKGKIHPIRFNNYHNLIESLSNIKGNRRFVIQDNG
ncbi:small ribosomal subunit biogenesis GTPase RsgA [Avibacterium paragallinarum]|uniref:small ribosomal subunit biogenesis GTPase RsgA n=1 Tax=Avibacterium paragallinarum TaxID=728 RepID=UPI00021AD1AF|nr:small ribosomal subunit biogenesis GTPase RsgA [Avibacterium paragallinarum]AZI14211.1 small ribosomal subunit biogenesis GTPase RsgA [Avibacterium paragallinarum]QIR11682.1 small ribosomal subunit biogenesis GTPase RsgA [Avibacterium paragallinarum]QJE09344.1 small ribosomal subunit biogenesis GTPase RsgA [Avibacterium paragallinarum]QJE11539.1 small ribosomal subunit biogenesis GTPase RsgA [Avibacterium paragallinarum]QJE13739.1 small ribosomal subunit biogenesis GTPase RsgA [Avibacterium